MQNGGCARISKKNNVSEIALRNGNHFKQLKKVKEKRDNSLKTNGTVNVVIDDLIEVCTDFFEKKLTEDPFKTFTDIQKKVKNIEYSLKDVESLYFEDRLVDMIRGYYPMITEKKEFGVFTMSLLEPFWKKEQTIFLDIKETLLKPNYLGMGLGKGESLIINGDVASKTGYWLRGGNLEIYGNTGMATGLNMETGNITVYGNSGPFTGQSMEGGRITVYGQIFSRSKTYGGIIEQRTPKK